MRTLTGNTVVAHPVTHDPQVLLAGDPLPDWAAGLVGEHLLTEDVAVPVPEPDKPEDVAVPVPEPDKPEDVANQPPATPKRASRRR